MTTFLDFVGVVAIVDVLDSASYFAPIRFKVNIACFVVFVSSLPICIIKTTSFPAIIALKALFNNEIESEVAGKTNHCSCFLDC